MSGVWRRAVEARFVDVLRVDDRFRRFIGVTRWQQRLQYLQQQLVRDLWRALIHTQFGNLNIARIFFRAMWLLTLSSYGIDRDSVE